MLVPNRVITILLYCLFVDLSLFREQADNPLMIYHGMNVMAAITKHLNPDKSPVLVIVN